MRNASNNMHRELFITVPPLYLRRLLSRLRGLFGSVNEPVLETRLSESRVIVRNQRPLAHLDAVIPPVRVGDHLAGILKRRQVPPDEFIQTKLFGSPDFNGAIHG